MSFPVILRLGWQLRISDYYLLYLLSKISFKTKNIGLTNTIILILKEVLLCSQLETTISTISNTDIVSVTVLICTTIDLILAFNDIVKFIRSIIAKSATDLLNTWFHNLSCEFRIGIGQIQPLADQLLKYKLQKFCSQILKNIKFKYTTQKLDFIDIFKREYIGLKLSARFIPVPGMDIKDTNPESTNK